MESAREVLGLIGSALAICVGSTGLFILLRKPIAATGALLLSLILGIALLAMSILSAF